MKRLKTEYIDIYFLHRFDEHTPLEETLRALDDVVAQGKVRYTGVSNFAAWQIAKALGISACNGWTSFDCIQPMYNLVKRQAEVEILPHALNLRNSGSSPTTRWAVGCSQRKIHRGSSIGLRDAWPTTTCIKSATVRNGCLKPPGGLANSPKNSGYHPVSLAVAWVSHHPAVTAPILGARNVEQLEDALRSVDIRLSPELYADICRLTPTPPSATDRSEEIVQVTRKAD